MKRSIREGDVVGGRYRVQDVLGEGGMAVVWRARNTGTDGACAVKLIRSHLVERPELCEMFVREAKVGARIGRNPYIVDVFDAGIDEQLGVPFLAMELLEGESLFQRVERDGPLPHALVQTLFEQLADALEQAHEAGVVHRDLKPTNLFLTHDRRQRPVLKVLDFGIAKVLEQEAQRTATQVGTPAYAAPEQLGATWRTIAGRQGITIATTVSPATDVWALGLVAYDLLTGRSPGHYWGAETLAELPAKIILEDHEPASKRAGDRAACLPPGFDPWFARCLERDATRRFQLARDAIEPFLELLRKAAEAPHPPPTELAPPAPRGETRPLAVHAPAPAAAPAPSSEGGVEARPARIAPVAAETALVLATFVPGAAGAASPAAAGNAPQAPEATRKAGARPSAKAGKSEKQTASGKKAKAAAEKVDAGGRTGPAEATTDAPIVLSQPSRRAWPKIVAGVVALGAVAAIAVVAIAPKLDGAAAHEPHEAEPAPPEVGALATPSAAPSAEPPPPPVRMIAIPAGNIVMGNGGARFKIAAFEMDETEVSLGAYRECVEGSACVIKGVCNERATADRPVACATWVQADTYCRWRGKRLPTEPEWEYAARGTDGRKYPWGNDPPDAQVCWRGKPDLCPVGSYPAGKSAFGLLDMAGNVSEWTSTDNCPNGKCDPKKKNIRGGSVGEYSDNLLATSGQIGGTTTHYTNVGFRCAK